MASPLPHLRLPTARRYGRALAAAFLALTLAGCTSAIEKEMAKEAKASVLGKGSISSPESLMRIAEHTRRGGDVASAITFYHRASLAAPDDPTPIIRMASLMYEVGAYRDAEAAFSRALGIDAEHVEALRGLGHVLVALDRPREAATHYQTALRIVRDPRTIAGLGVALDMAGDHATAQQTYRDGLAEYPASLTMRNNLGLSLALTGQYDEAVALLREVATHPAATPRHRQNLALAYGLAGRPEMAAELGRLDLKVGEVRNNLDYYSWLRAQAQTAAASPPLNPVANRAANRATVPTQDAGATPATPRDIRN